MCLMHTEYRIWHITRAMDTQFDFHASSSCTFLDLVILPTAARFSTGGE